MKRFITYITLVASVINAIAGVPVEICYWIDRNDTDTDVLIADSDNITFEFDTKPYLDGYHTLHYKIKPTDGTWSPVFSSLFFIKSHRKDDATTTLLYWVDNNESEAVEITLQNKSAEHSANLNMLDDGYHFLYYRMVNGNKLSPNHSTLIFKKSRIDKFEWCKSWWNDRVDLMETVSVVSDDVVSSLSSTLTVPKNLLESCSPNDSVMLNVIFGTSKGVTSEIITCPVAINDNYTAIDRIQTPDRKWNIVRENSITYLNDLIQGNGLVKVYTIDGKMIYQVVPVADRVELPDLSPGVYIVTYDGMSRKIAVSV